MARIAKLLAKLHSGRLLTFADLQTLLNAYGFRLDRVAGSHHVYVHPALIGRSAFSPMERTRNAINCAI